MGTNCCNCGDIQCDEDHIYLEVDRYKAIEIKNFTRVDAKKFERFQSSYGSSYNEPEKFLEEETLFAVTEGQVFENNKGQTEVFNYEGGGDRITRSEISVRSKLALRFEIDDVYDWGKENDYGHKFINSIYFRPIVNYYSSLDEKRAVDTKHTKALKEAGIGDLFNYYQEFQVDNPLPIGSKESLDPELENQGIQYVVYKMGADESMPSSMEEFDEKFESGGKIPFLTKHLNKVFYGAELQDAFDGEEPRSNFGAAMQGFSGSPLEYRGTGVEGVAKLEYKETDLRDIDFNPYNFHNRGYQNHTEIPYEKISSNGSYVILVDCPNVGTYSNTGNKALIELRRINGVDLYQAPQKFLQKNDEYGFPLPDNEVTVTAITGARCDPSVRVPTASPTAAFESVEFDIDTTPRFDPTSCNLLGQNEGYYIDPMTRRINGTSGEGDIPLRVKPDYSSWGNPIVDWHDYFVRIGDGEYVSKESFMDTKISFDKFLPGVNYFLAGGKVELEVFKEKQNNLISGRGETYLQTIYELSYDRELEMIMDYSRYAQCNHPYGSSASKKAGGWWMTAIDDVVSREVVDPTKFEPSPDRFSWDDGVGWNSFTDVGTITEHDVMAITKSKTQLLTTPSEIIKDQHQLILPSTYTLRTSALRTTFLNEKRSHWTFKFKPSGDQAKYIHRLKYRVLEGSSRFMEHDHVVQEFLSLHKTGELIPLYMTDTRGNGKHKPHGCYGNDSYYLTTPHLGMALITHYPDRFDYLYEYGFERALVEKFIGYEDASDPKYKTIVPSVGDRYGIRSNNYGTTNFLSTIYIRGCVIESGAALVDIESDLEAFSPNETYNYASVPHYGNFSPAKFRFKLINPQYYPKVVSLSDVNDACPKECIAMEHPMEWKVLYSDWDVGEPSELSTGQYGCTTVLDYKKPLDMWGGSYTIQTSDDVVLASYTASVSQVYASCGMYGTKGNVHDEYPLLNTSPSIWPKCGTEDLVFDYDDLGDVCRGAGISDRLTVDKVYRTSHPFGATGPPFTTFSHPTSIFVPGDGEFLDSLHIFHGMTPGYNSHIGGFDLSEGKGAHELHYFQSGSTSYSFDTGAFLVENWNSIRDVIDTQPRVFDGKYGERHEISVCEVSWTQTGDVFESRYPSITNGDSTYPSWRDWGGAPFNIERFKDFIVGVTQGLDLGYGAKAYEYGTSFLTEITSGTSEYPMQLADEKRWGGVGNGNYYNPGAGLRFRVNSNDGEDDCSGQFENDMLFMRRYSDENRTFIAHHWRWAKSQSVWAIENGYATLLYQQYIPIVQMLLSKSTNSTAKEYSNYIEKIVSLIKDTDVEKYWYKLGVDAEFAMAPEDEGYLKTEIKAGPNDTKVIEIEKSLGEFVDVDDVIFTMGSQLLEVKNEFFDGTVFSIYRYRGRTVNVGTLIMRTKFGDTTRDVVSPVKGIVDEIMVSENQSISNGDVLVKVMETSTIKSPVDGKITEINVEEGEDVVDGQSLAGVVNTITYPKDSYFYVDQEGNDEGPFDSPEGFVFKKSTGEYEVLDGVDFDLEGQVVGEGFTDRINCFQNEDLSRLAQGQTSGRCFQDIYVTNIGTNLLCDGRFLKKISDREYEYSFAEGSLSDVNFGTNSTDFGFNTVPDEFINPVSGFKNDDIIPIFYEWEVDKTLASVGGAWLGFDYDESIHANPGGFYTEPFTTTTGYVEITKTAPAIPGIDSTHCFSPGGLVSTPSCEKCEDWVIADPYPYSPPICTSVAATGRTGPGQDYGWQSPPYSPGPVPGCVKGGETVTFTFETTSTTNDSSLFDNEYSLSGSSRGAWAKIQTYFGFSDAFEDIGLNEESSRAGGNVSSARFNYRKLVDKSEFSKCEKLPNIFFDYCNLVTGSELSHGGSPEAHITTGVEYRDLPYSLNSIDVFRGPFVYRNSHTSHPDPTQSYPDPIVNDSIFPTDQQISQVGSALDGIPETVPPSLFGILFDTSVSLWSAPLDKNRMGLVHRPLSYVCDAEVYEANLYTSSYGSMYVDDYQGEVDRVRDVLLHGGLHLSRELLYYHLYGVRGATGYIQQRKSNAVRPPNNEATCRGEEIKGSCGVSTIGIDLPPGGPKVPLKDTCCGFGLSDLSYSMGMSVFEFPHEYGYTGATEVGFDFVEYCQGYDIFGRSAGRYYGIGYGAGDGEKDVYGCDDNGYRHKGNPIQSSDNPNAPRSPSLPIQMGVIVKRKIVPLSEYFFTIGDATSEI